MKRIRKNHSVRLSPASVLLATAVILLLSSCSGYHYVAPQPQIPQFDKAGDVDIMGGPVAHEQMNFTAAVSPVKHIGLIYNYTGDVPFSRNVRTEVNSLSLQFYTPMTPSKRTFWYAQAGYDKGNTSNISNPLNPDNRTTQLARYETIRLSSGFYTNFGFPYLKFGLDLTYHHINFTQLQTDHNQYNPRQNWLRYEIMEPTTYSIFSPSFHITCLPLRKEEEPDRFTFYIRQSMGTTIPTGEPLTMRQLYPQSGYVFKEEVKYHPKIDRIFITLAVGIRFNGFPYKTSQKKNTH
jgi:hypothetical protein